LQLSNRSARRLQAVCVKLSQAQPQPHKVSLSYKGHGIHNYWHRSYLQSMDDTSMHFSVSQL
jgi:hypothetical protein